MEEQAGWSGVDGGGGMRMDVGGAEVCESLGTCGVGGMTGSGMTESGAGNGVLTGLQDSGLPQYL